MTQKFTPTEELALEVLIARARLGEGLWTFDGMCSKALTKLEEKGYVRVMHGVTDRTVRAMLTKQGTSEFLSSNYKAPIFKQVKDKLLSQLEEMCMKGDGFITQSQIVKLREAVQES